MGRRYGRSHRDIWNQQHRFKATHSNHSSPFHIQSDEQHPLALTILHNTGFKHAYFFSVTRKYCPPGFSPDSVRGRRFAYDVSMCPRFLSPDQTKTTFKSAHHSALLDQTLCNNDLSAQTITAAPNFTSPLIDSVV